MFKLNAWVEVVTHGKDPPWLNFLIVEISFEPIHEFSDQENYWMLFQGKVLNDNSSI